MPKSSEPRSHSSAHRHVRLAQGSYAAVDRCPCGTLQLHVGPVSVRLPADALSDLWATLEQAAVAAAQHSQESPALLTTAGEA